MVQALLRAFPKPSGRPHPRGITWVRPCTGCHRKSIFLAVAICLSFRVSSVDMPSLSFQQSTASRFLINIYPSVGVLSMHCLQSLSILHQMNIQNEFILSNLWFQLLSQSQPSPKGTVGYCNRANLHSPVSRELPVSAQGM